MPDPTIIPNNSEIDKALKEFETKNAEQKQQILETLKTSPIPQKEVSGISFETDNLKRVNYDQETDIPKMVQLVMKWSGVQVQKQAEYILLIFVIVAIIIAIGIFFKPSNFNSTSHPIDNAAMQRMRQNMSK